MSSMIGRAAARFDQRFAALPQEKRNALALAMYRAAPMMRAYADDLEGLFDGDEMQEAIWDLLIAVAVKVGMSGKKAFSEKVLAEVAEAAPVVGGFMRTVSAAIERGPRPAAAFEGKVIPMLEAPPVDDEGES